MTVKYLFLSAYTRDDYDTYRKKFADCHCPMDSIMCQIVKEEFDKDASDDAKAIKQRYQHGKSTWKGYLNLPWSSMKRDNESVPVEYSCFQEIVKYLVEKENLIPIEYDYKYWEKGDQKN